VLVTATQLPLESSEVETIYEELLEREYRNLPLREIFSGLSPEPKGLNRIEMSTRARNVLWRQNINSLRGLGDFSISEINDFRNSGPGTLYEIVSLYLKNLRVGEHNEKTEEHPVGQHEEIFPRSMEKAPVEYLPLCAVKFLDQISRDLEVRDLHIINARSNLGERLTHGSVAEDWGVSRQRIHQIENHLFQRFRQEPLLEEIRNIVLPVNSFRGSSELLQRHAWLNLGVAIHPIGASILQILIFSQMLIIDQGWIISNEHSKFQLLETRLMEKGLDASDNLEGSTDISPEVRNYLQTEINKRRGSSNNYGPASDLSRERGNWQRNLENGDELLDKFIAAIRKTDG
jgi:hypothetical protein